MSFSREMPEAVVAVAAELEAVQDALVKRKYVVAVGMELRADVPLRRLLMLLRVSRLRPLGALVKRAYYYIIAGLLMYALITYAPFVAGWHISAAAGTIFTAIWAASVLTVAFGVFMPQRFRRREKRVNLRRLEDERRSYMDYPWDVLDFEAPADEQNRIEDCEQRIDMVSATREYPATFTIWTHLVLSVAIPKTLQVLLALILG